MSTKALFWALKSQIGNPHQKLILITLADIANERGECWPSHQYLADRAECHRSTVIRHLKALEERGLIRITRRADGDGLKASNVYALRCSDVAERNIPDVAERNRGSSTALHNTPIDTPTCINRAAWTEWLEYRKQAKKKMTPATIKKQHKFLADYDFDTQQQIIDTSIENGWTGLFRPKVPDKPKRRGTRDTDIRDDLTDTSWAH